MYQGIIRQEFEQTTRRSCSIGALYTTLDRLEAKGFVETWLGDPTPERGGRAKRMVRVTKAGRKAATLFYETVVRATHGTQWESVQLGARTPTDFPLGGSLGCASVSDSRRSLCSATPWHGGSSC